MLKNQNLSDNLLMIVIYLFLAILAVSIVVPFIIIFLQSVTPWAAREADGWILFLIPSQVSFAAYDYLLFSSRLVLTGLKNSLFLVVVGGSLSLLLTTMAAYALAKSYLPYRRILTYFVYIPMIISGGLIPSFLVVKAVGLYGSIWACVIPGMVSSWNVFLMRNFFRELPDSLEEAARLDGANDLVILFRVVLPISLPALATIGLFYGVAQWNSWFLPSLYLRTRDQWPLQMIVRQMLDMMSAFNSDDMAAMEETLMNMPTENVKKAAVFVTTIPVLLFYPFAQKYFIKGLVVGSVKG